jgi:hypothetical protein
LAAGALATTPIATAEATNAAPMRICFFMLLNLSNLLKGTSKIAKWT